MGNVDPTHGPMAPMRYQITCNRGNIMALKAVLLAVLRFAGSWTPRTPPWNQCHHVAHAEMMAASPQFTASDITPEGWPLGAHGRVQARRVNMEAIWQARMD